MYAPRNGVRKTDFIVLMCTATTGHKTKCKHHTENRPSVQTHQVRTCYPLTAYTHTANTSTSSRTSTSAKCHIPKSRLRSGHCIKVVTRVGGAANAAIHLAHLATYTAITESGMTKILSPTSHTGQLVPINSHTISPRGAHES